MRTCTLRLKDYVGKKCYFRLERYLNGTMAIEAYQMNKDGYEESVLTATVNLGELPDGYAVIKDYSENEGLLACLTKLGIVESVQGYVTSGYVCCPVCKINMQVLKEYSV